MGSRNILNGKGQENVHILQHCFHFDIQMKEYLTEMMIQDKVAVGL